jgi:hypothetical protein
MGVTNGEETGGWVTVATTLHEASQAADGLDPLKGISSTSRLRTSGAGVGDRHQVGQAVVGESHPNGCTLTS